MEEENTSCDDQIDILLLPEDVLIQILVLLPVISLLRFKSVCKSWRALIQSSFFIDLHLNTTTTNNNNNKFGTFIYQTSDFYLPSKEEKKSEAFILSAAGGDDDEDNNEFEKLLKWEDLVFPPRYKFSPKSNTDNIRMVGSCNGLICIHDKKGGEISLWNPATRQFRILPESLILEEIPGYVDEYWMPTDFVAFGYDVKTNDYKVVLISYLRPYMSGDRWISVEKYIFRVQVYSLTTDSWRLLEGINSLPALPRQTNCCNHGVYLNGSYYFMGSYLLDSKPTLMLLSFDFNKEIFTTIQLPHDYHLTMRLTSFREKQLAVFARKPDESIFVNESIFVPYDVSVFVPYDVWVLNKHGVKEEEEESWTKLLSIRLNNTENFIRGMPRSISNNGEFALIYTEGYRVINGGGGDESRCCLLQLFNLGTQEVQKEFHTGTVIRAEVYKQSLVWIGGNDTTV